MYANKVNGKAAAGESLTGNIDFITITTAANILQKADGDATSQARLDKLVEIISLNGQPVIMGAPTFDSGDSTYTLKFAVEHTGVWTADTLEAAIVAHQASGMGFTANNTSIVVSGTI